MKRSKLAKSQVKVSDSMRSKVSPTDLSEIDIVSDNLLMSPGFGAKSSVSGNTANKLRKKLNRALAPPSKKALNEDLFSEPIVSSTSALVPNSTSHNEVIL